MSAFMDKVGKAKTLAIVGGGGFACEVLEVARLRGYTVEDYYATGEGRVGLRYCGYLDELERRRGDYDGIVLGFGAVNQAGLAQRTALAERLAALGFDFPALVSPHAVVSEGASIGAGSFVAHGVVVSVDARIDAFCLLNTSAIVGHHTVVGRHTIVSPKVFIGGDCRIDEQVLIGAGANILQARHIGQGAMVGVGADIYRDVKAGTTVWPARYQVTGG